MFFGFFLGHGRADELCGFLEGRIIMIDDDLSDDFRSFEVLTPNSQGVGELRQHVAQGSLGIRPANINGQFVDHFTGIF